VWAGSGTVVERSWSCSNQNFAVKTKKYGYYRAMKAVTDG